MSYFIGYIVVSCIATPIIAQFIAYGSGGDIDPDSYAIKLQQAGK